MRKRDFSAHLLRESDSDDGIFQASVFPPTKISLASVKLRNRKNRKEEVSLLEKISMGNQSLEKRRQVKDMAMTKRKRKASWGLE